MLEPTAIAENQARMETARASYDQYWAEIARLVYPELATMFAGGAMNSPWMRNQAPQGLPHDPYAAQALEDGVSVFQSFIMPQGQRWQAFELGDEALMAKVPVQLAMDRVSRRLFGLRNDPQSGFVNAWHESAMSLFSFGPQSLWIDDRWDAWGQWAGLSYESEFIGDIWFERDASGNVFRVHRKLCLTAEQAVMKWKDRAPPLALKAMAETKPRRDAMFEYIHVIEPNPRFDPERIDLQGKPWYGCYYSVQDKLVFDHGGYHSMPRVVSAYSRAGRSNWGRSPTFMLLPVIRMGQAMMQDRAWHAELTLKPPFLTTDDGLDGAVLEVRPHGVTEGGLDDRGNPLVREFLTQADGADAEKIQALMWQMIDKGYFRDLLQLRREYKSHISATRTEEEKVEKGLLLAPLGRQEGEAISPMTQRELSLMDQRGLLDDLPGEVREYLGAGGTIGIKYDNGLTRLQEANGSAAFLSTANKIAALAQFDPSYVEDFKREYPSSKVIPELARIDGVPAVMRASDDERAEYDRQKAEAAQLDQLLAAAPALAGAAKDAAAISQPLPV